MFLFYLMEQIREEGDEMEIPRGVVKAIKSTYETVVAALKPQGGL